MRIDKALERSMSMSDEVWLRHANPWSVWTRVATLPGLLLALYSAHWIGWWSVLPVATLVVWIWVNPRAFPTPERTDHWGAMAVMGERVWLARKEIPIPRHHSTAAFILSFVAGLGLPFCIYGLIWANPWAVLLGTALVYMGKMWFLDRMVWLYIDMKDHNDTYRSWLKPGLSDAYAPSPSTLSAG